MKILPLILGATAYAWKPPGTTCEVTHGAFDGINDCWNAIKLMPEGSDLERWDSSDEWIIGSSYRTCRISIGKDERETTVSPMLVKGLAYGIFEYCVQQTNVEIELMTVDHPGGGISFIDDITGTSILVKIERQPYDGPAEAVPSWLKSIGLAISDAMEKMRIEHFMEPYKRRSQPFRPPTFSVANLSGK